MSFPASPSNNQLYTNSSGVIYRYNTTTSSWTVVQTGTPGASGTNVFEYDVNDSYKIGDVASYGGFLITPNNPITGGTPFSWGVSGPSWRPYGLRSGTWMGAWSGLNNYVPGDVVGVNDTLTGFIATALAVVSSTNVPPATATPNWQVTTITPAQSKPFIGATNVDPGTTGIVPAPAAGDQNKYLRGDGTWQNHGGGGGDPVLAYVPADTYNVGDVVTYLDILVTPNATVPGGTAFAWGTTGATWRPMASNLGVWRGQWNAGTAYVANDIVGYNFGVGGSDSFGYAISLTSNTGVNPLSDAKIWTIITTSPNKAQPFTGATVSTTGHRGLVPAPVSGQETQFLRGDGTWATPAGGGGSTNSFNYNNTTSAGDFIPTVFNEFAGLNSSSRFVLGGDLSFSGAGPARIFEVFFEFDGNEWTVLSPSATFTFNDGNSAIWAADATIVIDAGGGVYANMKLERTTNSGTNVVSESKIVFANGAASSGIINMKIRVNNGQATDTINVSMATVTITR